VGKNNNSDIMGEQTTLPRMKPIPTIRKLTKWQKFALDKGIKKKDRSRMVFDEQTKTWVPRWGSKSLKHQQEERVAIVRQYPEHS